MEHISEPQLQKYEGILNKIDSEFKKFEALKKQLQKETNQLIAIRLAMEEKVAKENVFHVIVKIFGSVFELFYLYDNEIATLELDSLRKLCSCKFYLIEVYISKLFQQKIASMNWFLNVCVTNSKMCVNKNVSVGKKHISDRIIIVVPFDISSENATVTTNLLIYFDTFCTNLRINTADIDISYHFTSKESISPSPVVKIAQNYKADLSRDLLRIPTLNYKFKCACSTKHFFESVVQNCYHRLNTRIFSAFTSENANVIAVDFVVSGEGDVTIELDNTESVLSITSGTEILHRIKKYFIEEIQCQTVSVEKGWMVTLMNTKECLRAELGQAMIDPNNLKIMYEDLRALICALPV